MNKGSSVRGRWTKVPKSSPMGATRFPADATRRNTVLGFLDSKEYQEQGPKSGTCTAV